MNNTEKILIGKNDATKLINSKLMEQNVETMTKDANGIDILDAIYKNEPSIVIIPATMQHIDALGLTSISFDTITKPNFIIIGNTNDDPCLVQMLQKAKNVTYIEHTEDTNKLNDQIHVLRHTMSMNTKTQQELDITASKILHKMGMPVHLNGYDYLRTAITLAVQNNNMIRSITGLLYPTIANKFETTPTRVERAIRHGIEVAWSRGDTDAHNEYFGYTINNDRGKPTNSEFIAMLADRIRLQQN